jgi:hypothetical protein
MGMIELQRQDQIHFPERTAVPLIRHFKVEFLNVEGKTIGNGVFSYEASLTETTSILPYFVAENEIHIGLKHFPCRALSLRQHLPVVRDGENSAALLGFDIRPGVPNNPLPGPFVPSAGSSCELSHLLPVQLDQRVDLLDGELQFMSAKNIIQAYLEGSPLDTRVVLAALRLADRYESKLDLGLSLTNESAHSPSDRVLPCLNQEQLEELQKKAPSDPSVAFGVRCQETSAPLVPFLSTVRVPGTESWITVRKGVDAVDVGAYVWRNGEICLVFKRGLRPALAIRKLLDGEPPNPTDALTLEGIAESLEGEQTFDEIGQRAAQGVREEAGFEIIGTPVYVGSSFPSPRTHAERVFNYIVEVDPNRAVDAEHTIDERVDVWCAPTHVLISLCEKGIIQDPRLEINARLLRRCSSRMQKS